MAADTYSAEPCSHCAEPAAVLVLDKRGHVCAAGCAEHRGAAIRVALAVAVDHYVIRTERQKVTR
jgi:hypothetical protein